mmetsp:Transcript_71504/g.198473  ORF Transcript_71504/g.198473 Transcript_71504/m.198473 type:complete len:348 (-) Transcript_71504:82-1125(-)
MVRAVPTLFFVLLPLPALLAVGVHLPPRRGLVATELSAQGVRTKAAKRDKVDRSLTSHSIRLPSSDLVASAWRNASNRMRRLSGRVPVLVTGAAGWGSAENGGKGKLRPLVEAIALRMPLNSYLKDNIVLVGSSATRSDQADAPWENVHQEVFFDLASRQEFAMPMVMLQPRPANTTSEAVQVEMGVPIKVHLEFPSTHSVGEDSRIERGWYNGMTPISLCFGGDEQTLSYVQKHGSEPTTTATLKDGALPVPAAGGVLGAFLVQGPLRDWKPAALDEKVWERMKSVAPGNITTADGYAKYADLVLGALVEIVHHEQKEGFRCGTAAHSRWGALLALVVAHWAFPRA